MKLLLVIVSEKLTKLGQKTASQSARDLGLCCCHSHTGAPSAPWGRQGGESGRAPQPAGFLGREAPVRGGIPAPYTPCHRRSPHREPCQAPGGGERPTGGTDGSSVNTAPLRSWGWGPQGPRRGARRSAAARVTHLPHCLPKPHCLKNSPHSCFESTVTHIKTPCWR